MRTALDESADTLDANEQSFVAEIREHGWFRTGVFAETGHAGFSYTTGFWWSIGQPELIMFSVKHEIAHNVFWDVFRDAKASQILPIANRTDQVFGNLPAFVFPVAKRHYAEHLGWSRWFYGGDEFPCLQIVWPDRNGVFPWEKGFDDEFVDDQPDLTDSGWLASLG